MSNIEVNQEELKEWAENIPMDMLFMEIKRLTGLSDLKFTYKVYEGNNGLRISFESQDLTDKVGFLKLMFSEIKITDFSSKITYNEKEDGTIEYVYWGTTDFKYEHPSSGRNGYSFLSFAYTDRKGWVFHQM
ncbi:MAG: hypothetical protein VZS44_12195 [Bacilli bacterium]|nr:hypothetical protein [Bacilli bacterium]